MEPFLVLFNRYSLVFLILLFVFVLLTFIAFFVLFQPFLFGLTLFFVSHIFPALTQLFALFRRHILKAFTGFDDALSLFRAKLFPAFSAVFKVFVLSSAQ